MLPVLQWLGDAYSFEFSLYICLPTVSRMYWSVKPGEIGELKTLPNCINRTHIIAIHGWCHYVLL